MSQPPNQPPAGPPYPDQPHSGPPHSGQPQSGPPSEQPWSATPASGYPEPGQPYPGQPDDQTWSTTPPPGYTGQPQPGQPWSAGPPPDYPGQPQPSQLSPGPYQGQPNPDVPSSVPPQPGYPPQPVYAPQPSYPQPDYGPPGDPQPDYAQPGYPPQGGYPQPGAPLAGYPAPKKSRALPITLISIALVLVVCVGGGTAVYLAGRNTAKSLADTISSAAPTPGATSTAPEPTISIVEPRTLGGRPRLTDPAYTGLTDQLEKNLALLPGASQSVGAIYGTPAKRNVVLVVAAKSLVGDPKQEVDEAFDGPAFENLKLTGVASIPPGPLGGAAKCAKGKDAGVSLSLCAWADEGSSGLLIWYLGSLNKAKNEFVRLRGQIEQKSN